MGQRTSIKSAMKSVENIHAPKVFKGPLIHCLHTRSKSEVTKYLSHTQTHRNQNYCKSYYVLLFTINTVCTARLNSTLLSSNSKLKYYNTSHMNICTSTSKNYLTDVVVNIFSYWALAQYKSHIYRHLHIYLHWIFLQSIEKINSITFIITLCILVGDSARVHDRPHVAFWLHLQRLQQSFYISEPSKQPALPPSVKR